MKLVGKRIGFAITGSFCTFQEIMGPLQALVTAGAMVYPIMSEAAYRLDSRFGTASQWQETVTAITGREIIHSIEQAEPIGPNVLFDLIIIAPCTGNTLAKLANAITDTAVTMAAKAHLRNGRPVLISISTNDGLGLNAKNLGLLLAARNIFFVPFGQDNPKQKPTSLVADSSLLVAAAEQALIGKQLQPVLIGRYRT
ncbi:MAG TPA: dipicolinate synthase subunit B [Firmicutes bacterium]|nr:dipicolinate synthase subunit B [Bacillota bacterium]